MCLVGFNGKVLVLANLDCYMHSRKTFVHNLWFSHNNFGYTKEGFFSNS